MADPLVERCRSAMRLAAMTHPWFLVIFSRVRHLLRVVDGGQVDTMAIHSSGRILVNRTFGNALSMAQLGGVLCHELMHLAMSHHRRSLGLTPPEHHRANCAQDMCINTALIAEGLTLTRGALALPFGYRGPLVAEAVDAWLVRHPEHIPADRRLLAGCAVVDDGEPAAGGDWRVVAAELRRCARLSGHRQLATLLEERAPRQDWRGVLRHATQRALAAPGREVRSMARLSRRSPPTGPLLPGWRGGSPRVCVVADVSGSMSWPMVERIHAECRGLLRQFPGLALYLVAHTDAVEWEGEVRHRLPTAWEEALGRAGGTDPEPAYRAAAARGRFDALVHFTDCCFDRWPEVPARRLVVGHFGGGGCTPPAGALVIPCEPR